MLRRKTGYEPAQMAKPLAAGLLALCLWTGCTSMDGTTGTDAEAEPLVWPAAPAKPRIALVKSISGPKDCGIRPSLWQFLAGVFAGPDPASRGFVKPVSVALDDDGSICVADPGLSAVVLIDRKRRELKTWHRIRDIELTMPVAVAKAGNTIFVADSDPAKILAFTVKGELVWAKTNGVTRPSGLAILGETLLVADAGAHRVIAVDSGGRTIMRFGRRGTGNGEFNFPTHIAVGTAGTGTPQGPLVFVTDSMNHRVQVFEPTGRFVRAIGSVGDTSGHLSKPKGVAVDATGHVYVVDALFDNVQVFDQEGRFLLHWGEAGSAPGEFWLPSGIAAGNNHEILVADSYNGRLQSFRYVGHQSEKQDVP